MFSGISLVPLNPFNSRGYATYGGKLNKVRASHNYGSY